MFHQQIIALVCLLNFALSEETPNQQQDLAVAESANPQYGGRSFGGGFGSPFGGGIGNSYGGGFGSPYGGGFGYPGGLVEINKIISFKID